MKPLTKDAETTACDVSVRGGYGTELGSHPRTAAPSHAVAASSLEHNPPAVLA
jgi:hypothetical protein